MDETTFQKELRELKQCVTDIANIPSPAPSASQLSNFMFAHAVHNDMFVAQLRDVRTRLDIMQASLLQHGRDQAPATGRQKQAVADPEGAKAFEGLDRNMNVLYTILDCSRDTNERITRLEQVISGLEATVIFTPASSETTIEDLTASQNAYAADDDTDLHEPKSATSGHEVPIQQNEHDRPATLSEVLEETWADGDNMLPPLIAICPPKLNDHSGPANLSDILNDSATLGDLEPPHDTIVTRQLDPISATVLDAHNGHRHFEVSTSQESESQYLEISRLQSIIWQQEADFEAKLSAKDAELSHLNTCRTAAEEASHITRTDLEDRLAENDSQLARWKDEAKAAQKGFEAMARCNRELQDARDHAIGRLRHDLKQCEESRHHFMTKYVDENYRFKWLEQRKLQSEQRLYQQLDECEQALDISERTRDADIRAAIQTRDEDLEQLYAFCQEKEAVVSHQDVIIAQGTSILHERDAEIDRLNVALAESQRGREYVRDCAGKFKRVIRKREDEIEDLKHDIRDERDRRHRLENSMRKDADVKKQKSKDVRFKVEERKPPGHSRSFVHSAESADRRDAMREQTPWTPQPINPDRLPHEEDRAALWLDGSHSAPEHRFGSASPVTRRKQPDARNGMNSDHAVRDHEKVHVQPPANFDLEAQMTPHYQRGSAVGTHVPFDEAVARIAAESSREHRHKSSQRGWYHPEPELARQEARVNASDRVIGGRSSRSSMEAQGAANSGTSENRRHALPLDATWLPPLPARASASAAIEKVSSVPNLRAGSHPSRSHDVGAIPKPASMLNLRPQSYAPPSVETEAESAEDQGGSSLLDV